MILLPVKIGELMAQYGHFVPMRLLVTLMFLGMVRAAGLEPAKPLGPADFKSAAFTNFATPAKRVKTGLPTGRSGF